MCWMMVKKAGKQPNWDYINKAQKHNADGYGVAWYEDGCVKTYKTFKFSQFKGVVAALKQHTLVIHLRYATKGNKSFNNIHPFDVPSGVMFHNGTMFGLGNVTKSDSQVLADTISECDYKFIEDIAPLVKPYIDDKINRLVFFEDNGRITIMNEDLGITEDDTWYSNDYHLKDAGWCRTGCTVKKTKKKEKETTVLVSPPKTKVYLHKVFVYGTLKRGYGNHSRFLGDAVYLGKAKTDKNWTMVGKDMPFPYLLEENNDYGGNVAGEVYCVDTDELRALDGLEGVPRHYIKKLIDVVYDDDSTTEQVTVYVKAQFNGLYPDTMPVITEWRN